MNLHKASLHEDDRFNVDFNVLRQYEDGMNVYQYAGTDPIGWVDPYGLKTWRMFDWFYSRGTNCGPWQLAGDPYWALLGEPFVSVELEGMDMPNVAGSAFIAACNILNVKPDATHQSLAYSQVGKACWQQLVPKEPCKRCCTVFQWEHYTVYDELGGRYLPKKRRAKDIETYQDTEDCPAGSGHGCYYLRGTILSTSSGDSGDTSTWFCSLHDMVPAKPQTANCSRCKN